MSIKLVNKPVGPIGYGLMGLTWRNPAPPTEQSIEAMKTALERGANFWNGGELYGTPERHSGHLLAEYFARYPGDAERVVLSIKGGLGKGTLVPDGRAANVRRSVDDVLATLAGTAKRQIDIFECARVDRGVALDETLGELRRLRDDEGKIAGVGLSEVGAATIERAVALAGPIAAVEVELSLWTTDVLRNGVAAACARHDIPLVAYSPLSRGALADPAVLTSPADALPPGDMRRHFPRFQDAALAQNRRLVDEVAALAARKGVTTAQVAIAWVRQLSGRTVPDGQGGTVRLGTVIPIPGATTAARVRENTELVVLTDDELAQIDDIIRRNPIVGERYPPAGMAHVEG